MFALESTALSSSYSPDKKLSLGSDCSLKLAKTVHGEEKMRGVVLRCRDPLVKMVQKIRS